MLTAAGAETPNSQDGDAASTGDLNLFNRSVQEAAGGRAPRPSFPLSARARRTPPVACIESKRAAPRAGDYPRVPRVLPVFEQYLCVCTRARAHACMDAHVCVRARVRASVRPCYAPVSLQLTCGHMSSTSGSDSRRLSLPGGCTGKEGGGRSESSPAAAGSERPRCRAA